MKAYMRKARRDAAFTLIELVTVVTIIALLFALVVGGFSFADKYSKRSKSEVTIKAVRSALENYKETFGGYPDPQTPAATANIGKKSYTAGEAACLYQALSGDGFDMIKGARGRGTPSSDGNLDEFEAKNVMLKDMPKEIFSNTDGLYYIIDGFGHPIRYIRALPRVVVAGTPPQPVTINADYDIWSYADDDTNIQSTSLQTIDGGTLAQDSRKWIKNW
jgi:prepilin-type N-terminal cleavage/methylation domain-containing protein